MKHLVSIGSAGLFASAASAGTILGFTGITHNSTTDVTIGESQFAVEIFDAAAGFADFRFTNAGPGASSITDIYFNNAPTVFADLVSIDDSHSGVSFSEGAAPPNPPGVNSFGTAFRLDSDAGRGGVAGNGVNPGEWVTVRMELLAGVSYNDLIAAFGNGLAIAIHTQAFAGGGSETFLSQMSIVPAPAGGALGAALFGVLATTRRRR